MVEGVDLDQRTHRLRMRCRGNVHVAVDNNELISVVARRRGARRALARRTDELRVDVALEHLLTDAATIDVRDALERVYR